MPRPIPGSTCTPSPSGPRWRITSHIAPISSREGVLPRVATPAMPHMLVPSGAQPFTQLHADLVAHEAPGRLQSRKPLERRAMLRQGAQETLTRPLGVEVDRDPETHAAYLVDVVRERQRVGPGQVAHAQSGRVREVLRIAPEDRPSAFIPEKQRRLSELLHQLVEQPAAAEEPLAGSPRDDPQHAADRPAVGKAVCGAENEDFEALPAGHLAPGHDEELPLRMPGHHTDGLRRGGDRPAPQA